MKIRKKSMISGEYHTMDLNVTKEELARFEGGEHAQNVFPNLNADEREFLISGVTPEEWDEMIVDYGDE